jgi:uncharacterized protein (DUF2235 family)
MSGATSGAASGQGTRTGTRNIVLFSDGTGNSSSSLFKTNVRRIYEALDLTDPQDPQHPRQFAIYDDGVGTSAFRPFAALGGAFGYGLARNVREIYAFLCRTYRPGDRIYAFGFSRGAFTVRVVIGLIMSQGIVRYDGSEAALARNVRNAFRAYRRARYGWPQVRSPLPIVGRFVRDAVLEGYRSIFLRNEPRYDKSRNEGAPVPGSKPVEVEFVGVWDTVDAYGLPIEELTRAVDALVLPLTMPDADLNPRVNHARHALSLDDQRNTFHPRLWNEAAPGAQGRIKQVWFAGVHADLGGGYPDDALAHVSLDWMVREAGAVGPKGLQLRFNEQIRGRQRALADENGPLHDSRRGFASYYRYKPRDVKALCLQDRTSTRHYEVRVERPRIHESVLRRIKVGQDGYAPINLPPAFDVELVDGLLVPGDEYLGLSSGGRRSFDRAQEHVWNHVWWRRVAYFVTLGGTLALGSLPFFLTDGACRSSACFLSPTIEAAGSFLPGFASTWVGVFAANPVAFLACLLVVGIGTLLGRRFDVRVPDEMRSVWYRLTTLRPQRANGQPAYRPPSSPGRVNQAVQHLRTSGPYKAFWRAATRFAFPTAAFSVAAVLFLGVLNAAILSGLESWGSTCQVAAGGRAAGAEMATGEFCHDTGTNLAEGGWYRVRVTVVRPPGWPEASSWKDKDYPAWPNGIRAEDLHFWMAALVPFRRHLGQPWYKLMARVGRQGGEVYAPDWRLLPAAETMSDGRLLDIHEAVLRARRDGPLFLYVNDAAPVVARNWLYRENNTGAAGLKVFVESLTHPRRPDDMDRLPEIQRVPPAGSEVVGTASP